MRPTLAPPYGKKYLLALIIPALMLKMTQAHAADDDEENLPHSDLGTLIVTATTTPDEQVGETILNRKMLDEQLINDSRDLVRYNPEVDVAEVGRYGNKGFAVRGVDGNRVNMNIDGMVLPEAEANEIFSPYGYMYEGRFNPDVEMMRSVRVHAGADSLTSGSGAVGGSVTYQTKRPRDLLNAHSDKPYGGYAKIGYSSKNEERLAAAGLAMDSEHFEFLINVAHREGSETKNHDMRRADDARLAPDYVFSEEEIPCIPRGTRCGNYTTKSLIYPDPKSFKRDSYLAKLYYKPNERHRIGIHGMHQRQENHINAESMLTFGGRLGRNTRRAHDVEKLSSYGASYHFFPSSQWLDSLELSHTHSDVLGVADTWVYDRNFDWQTDELKSVKLSNQEYRPTQTKSQQTSLTLDSSVFDWGKFGEHQLTLRGNYTHQDYTNSALYIGHGSTPNHLSHEFVDAKKTNHNLTLTDKIYLNDRFDATLGVRYDQYHYAPYFQNNVDGFDEYANKTKRCENSFNNTLFCQMHRRGERLGKLRAHSR